MSYYYSGTIYVIYTSIVYIYDRRELLCIRGGLDSLYYYLDDALIRSQSRESQFIYRDGQRERKDFIF